MNKLSCLALLLASLSGCAALGAPAVVEVKIPVVVPLTVPEIHRPAFAVEDLPIGADVWMQMRALRAERKQRMAYEAELEAVLDALRDRPSN